MMCPQCGQPVPEGATLCPTCGRQTAPTQSSVGGLSPLAPTMTSGQVTPEKTSGMAIASFIFGLLFLFFPLSILAVVFGHISLSQIKNSAGRLGGKGLAIAGLVLGYLGIALIPLILIIAAIAIPNLLRARIAANEDCHGEFGQANQRRASELSDTVSDCGICFRSTLSGLRYAQQHQPGCGLSH